MLTATAGCQRAAPPSLHTAFTALLDTLPAGEVGLVVHAGDTDLRFGDWAVGPAWSTIKVPISIAALRVDAATATPLITRAITASDNDAAMALWQLLGDPAAAGEQVHEVLSEADSGDTVVQTEQVYPPYSPFGQTRWSGIDAARFAFGLPCVPDADPVLTEMRRIVPEQRWGLAGPDTVSKAGWGPLREGGYLLRQLALLTTAAGTVGIALAAQPADGSHDTAVAMLNALGEWTRSHAHELPGGQC
ncbi:hypothetical protein A5643_00900 [Mycobacterium sp. 1274756.6]|nr:hypothetical protein A5643_00900 [Mycobacterium sp. 1274756.6]